MMEGTAARSLPTTSQCPAPVLSASSAVTPLQHMSPGTMATPDPERTYMHVRHWDYYKPGKERVREKMSMRYECKAFVKIKWNIKKDYWFFERIRLEHNHPLHPSPTVTHVDVMVEYMEIIKAATAREESENDIPKLLEFFRAMKAKNEYFYYELQDEKANTFEWLFGAFKNCMSGSRDPRCILTDQDSSMAAAIKEVFRQTQHRLCCWHMLKKYQAELKKLYKIHDGLKIKLLTVINHPLTPIEFESAWNELVDDYDIREDDAIQGLWESRKLWVVAYLKPLYCGRMTSTQRSESVNKMIKGSGFTGPLTCMSKFARRMLNFIQHTNHSAGNLRLTLQPFDGHLSRVYTRAVYKKYRETYIYSIAFRIEAHPNEVDVYMVTHTDQSWQYAWFQHSFRVEADVRSEYIMKRYTRGARTMVTWDRHDIVTSGPVCKSDQYKTKKLVEIAMAAVRACCKTSLGFEKGCEQLSALVEWGESIARGAVQILECAPREARTKGRNHGGKQVVNDHASSSKAHGQWTCGYCGSLEHYSMGCDVNPDNVYKKRGGSGSLRGKMGRKRGRPPTKRQLEDEFNDVA
uniref:Protein FAR1-RELATED SEQUENCE n=1 Tax=Setaria italica TaxID=4555 RepID=K3Y121_SETIT